MQETLNGLKVNFNAQVTAALMIQSNALIPIKMAVTLSSLSRQEIDRRVHNGTFPKPEKLSGEDKEERNLEVLRKGEKISLNIILGAFIAPSVYIDSLNDSTARIIITSFIGVGAGSGSAVEFEKALESTKKLVSKAVTHALGPPEGAVSHDKVCAAGESAGGEVWGT